MQGGLDRSTVKQIQSSLAKGRPLDPYASLSLMQRHFTLAIMPVVLARWRGAATPARGEALSESVGEEESSRLAALVQQLDAAVAARHWVAHEAEAPTLSEMASALASLRGVASAVGLGAEAAAIGGHCDELQACIRATGAPRAVRVGRDAAAGLLLARALGHAEAGLLGAMLVRAVPRACVCSCDRACPLPRCDRGV